MGGIIIEVGRCGFGCAGGLFPEARLGVVRVVAYRGSLLARLIGYFEKTEAALSIARAELQRRRAR